MRIRMIRRIRIGEFMTLEIGDVGTVYRTTDTATVHVRFDKGPDIGVLLGFEAEEIKDDNSYQETEKRR